MHGIVVVVLGGLTAGLTTGVVAPATVPAVAQTHPVKASAGCKAAHVAPGEQQVDTTSAGAPRSYLRRVPPAYDGTQPGPVVVLYRIEGGGHTWPDSKFSRAIEAAVGPTTISINADVMWSFFQAHPRRA